MTTPMTRATARMAAERFGIEPSALFTKCKRARFVDPRRYAWAILKAHGWSYPAIAGAWQDHEGRTYNHKTVLHGVRMVHQEWPDMDWKALAAEAWERRVVRRAS